MKILNDEYGYREENGRYYVSFIDGNGVIQESEVMEEVYKELKSLFRETRRIVRANERHIEQSEQNEFNLYEKTSGEYPSAEEMVLKKFTNEKLHKEIEKLSEKQISRIVMYYFEEKTLQEIADIECVNVKTVYECIKSGVRKISKEMKVWG